MKEQLIEKFKEWSQDRSLFDFDFPPNVEVEFEFDKKHQSASGWCFPFQKRIVVRFCNDLNENFHVLLHEMCHLNLAARGHDEVFKRSLVFATERITGTSLNPNKPCTKLNCEVAEAFGSDLRKNIREKNKKIKKEIDERHKLFAKEYVKIGDLAEFNYKVNNGFTTYTMYDTGTITDVNVETGRVHIKSFKTGENISRKINNVYIVRNVLEKA